MKQSSEDYHSQLEDLLRKDIFRMDILELVERIIGKSGWIGGGFVRHLVWDSILGKKSWSLEDVDVIFLGNDHMSQEKKWEFQLQLERPDVKWSVKDQNRMALKHGHDRYNSIEEALGHWVEKCTAVAVRYESGRVRIAAPYGLTELFEGIVSPTSEEMCAFLRERAREKGWKKHYPFLKIYT